MTQSLQIKLNSINQPTLKFYLKFLMNIFQKFHLNYTCINLPTTTKRITLLKSPHVYKKAREQFELHTYKAVLTLLYPKNSQLIKVLILNKPKNLKLKLKKV